MKVNLAVQIFSRSIASTLRWAYEAGLDGFTETDCLVTADFCELLDGLFDMLNSRGPLSPGLKAPLRIAKKEFWMGHLQKCDAVLKSLTEPNS